MDLAIIEGFDIEKSQLYNSTNSFFSETQCGVEDASKRLYYELGYTIGKRVIYTITQQILMTYGLSVDRKLRQNIKKSLIILVCRHLLNQPVTHQAKLFDTSQGVIDDSVEVAQLVTQFLDNIVDLASTFIIGGVALFSVSLKLLLIIIAPLPILMVEMYRTNSQQKESMSKFKKSQNENKSAVNLLAQRVLLAKAYAKIDYEIAYLYNTLDQQTEKLQDVASMRNRIRIAKKFSTLYAECVVTFIALREVLAARFTSQKAVRNLELAAQRCYTQIASAMEFIGGLSYALTVLKRILDTFGLKQEGSMQSITMTIEWLQKISTNSIQRPDAAFSSETSIELRNVTFSYNDQPMIQNMTTVFKSGRSYAITGKTGCGKSTLSALLLRFYSYKGKITINGINTSFIDLEVLRSWVTVAQQADQLITGRTLRENVSYGESLTGEQLSEILTASCVDFIKPDAVVDKLSGGEKQRICLARALARPFTRILVLDESTSALDESTEKVVLGNIKQFCAKRKIALVMIAHRPAVIACVDEVLKMEK